MQLSLFQPTAAPEQLTPFLVGRIGGFSLEDGWHEPDDRLLMQTWLRLVPDQLPELVPPYVDRPRQIHAGNAVAVGAGWAEPTANFVTARSLADLITTAEAAADLFEADPLYPWVPSTLRQVAEHWRGFDEPSSWEGLTPWPGDAHPEAL